MARRSAAWSRCRISFDDLVITGRGDIQVIGDNLSANQVLFDDAPRSFDIDVRIPDIVGINHDHRPVTALAHTAGVIDSNVTAHSRSRDAFLQSSMNVD
jgi:hypothetical protein